VLVVCAVCVPLIIGATPAAQAGDLAARGGGPRGVSPRGDITLTVFAAASLNEVFRQAAGEFTAANPGTSFLFNFAGSQQLSQQINLGARADLFAPADMRQMRAAGAMMDSSSIRVFARNRLVVVVPASPARNVRRLSDLGAQGVKIVLAARAVPAGEYALQFLGKCGEDPEFPGDFRSAVSRNVVSYEENVRAVLAKVVLAEADAGVVYVTDAASVATHGVDTIDIPQRLNVIAEYPVGRTRESTHPAVAERFIQFLISPRGQEILEKAGFTRAVSAPGSSKAKSSAPEIRPHE